MKLYRVADLTALQALDPNAYEAGARIQLESDDSVYLCREVTDLSGPTTAREFIISTDPFAADRVRATPTPASGANPTATAGETAVNGSASTFMRSDAAPAVAAATTSAKGIVELATNAETLAGTDTSRATTASAIRALIASGHVITIKMTNALSQTYAVAGTGNMSFEVDGWSELRTGATANSAIACIFTNTSSGPGLPQIGGGFSTISLARPIDVAFWGQVSVATTLGVGRIWLGKTVADGAGALARVGFGFRFDNLAVKGVYFTSGSESTVDLSTTLTAATNYLFRIHSDGAGNITWYINNVAVGTTASGPTSSSASGIFGFDVVNGNPGADYRFALQHQATFVMD